MTRNVPVAVRGSRRRRGRVLDDAAPPTNPAVGALSPSATPSSASPSALRASRSPPSAPPPANAKRRSCASGAAPAAAEGAFAASAPRGGRPRVPTTCWPTRRSRLSVVFAGAGTPTRRCAPFRRGPGRPSRLDADLAGDVGAVCSDGNRVRRRNRLTPRRCCPRETRRRQPRGEGRRGAARRAADLAASAGSPRAAARRRPSRTTCDALPDAGRRRGSCAPAGRRVANCARRRRSSADATRDAAFGAPAAARRTSARKRRRRNDAFAARGATPRGDLRRGRGGRRGARGARVGPTARARRVGPPARRPRDLRRATPGIRRGGATIPPAPRAGAERLVARCGGPRARDRRRRQRRGAAFGGACAERRWRRRLAPDAAGTSEVRRMPWPGVPGGRRWSNPAGGVRGQVADLASAADARDGGRPRPPDGPERRRDATAIGAGRAARQHETPGAFGRVREDDDEDGAREDNILS